MAASILNQAIEDNVEHPTLEHVRKMKQQLPICKTLVDPIDRKRQIPITQTILASPNLTLRLVHADGKNNQSISRHISVTTLSAFRSAIMALILLLPEIYSE